MAELNYDLLRANIQALLKNTIWVKRTLRKLQV